MGFDVKISTDKWPKNNKRVLGASLGSGVINWSESNSQFVPGAICDNLTSAGGIWKKPGIKSGQTQLTDYLNAGAAGASGTVIEPYAITAKFPTARLHVHYARGCTLAESFYQTISSPFQLLIVGDPLCCPFGDFPEFEIQGPDTGKPMKTDFDLSIVPKSTGPDIDRYELFFDGRYFQSIPKEQTIQVATENISDGFHEVRVAAVSNSLIATRKSQILNFVLQRDGHGVTVNVNPRIARLGETVKVTATSSSPGQEIEIRQNARVLGKISRASGKLSLNTARLGQGKSKLQGFVVVGGKEVASVPVEIEIVP